MSPRADARATVLVVEDEPTLRTSMVRGLSHALGADVVGAGTLAEARLALDAHPPAVMISDIDLPDGTGLELFRDLDTRGLKSRVILVSSYVRHYESQLPTHPGIETYEKPLPLERLRRIVEQALKETDLGNGGSPFLAADYLQLAGIGRKSVLIEVRARVTVGSIFVSGGSVVAAFDDRGEGMDAFRRLVFAEGEVTCRSLRSNELARTNLEGPCEELLMEAVRQNDEAALHGEDVLSSGWTAPPPRFSSLPPTEFRELPAIPATPPLPRSAGSFDALYESGVESLLDRRYDDALDFFTRANELRADDPRVAANLARLPALLARSAKVDA